MEKLDAVVIGAGVIGLAVARALALQGKEVIVLEQHKTFGQETSSRNSEVIHAGIYYPKNSLKALYCVRGKQLLYDYCRERHVSHKAIGKLIVAQDKSEITVLQDYIEKAGANGVNDLQLLSESETLALEPNISCAGAVLSPSTGIIDSHELMLNYIADIENNGGMIVYDSPVIAGNVSDSQHQLTLGGNSATTVRCNILVNSAGLYAPQVARQINVPEALVPECFYARGHYYSLIGATPFKRLIYPLANNAGLGIHATLDLDNRVRFGPDVQWVDKVDYQFDESRAPLFAEAIRRYYPEIKESNLSPSYTGIRPKICGPGEAPKDFVLQGPKAHGICNLVNLYGIESPGLTSSLAIAEEVQKIVD